MGWNQTAAAHQPSHRCPRSLPRHTWCQGAVARAMQRTSEDGGGCVACITVLLQPRRSGRELLVAASRPVEFNRLLLVGCNRQAAGAREDSLSDCSCTRAAPQLKTEHQGAAGDHRLLSLRSSRVLVGPCPSQPAGASTHRLPEARLREGQPSPVSPPWQGSLRPRRLHHCKGWRQQGRVARAAQRRAAGPPLQPGRPCRTFGAASGRLPSPRATLQAMHPTCTA